MLSLSRVLNVCLHTCAYVFALCMRDACTMHAGLLCPLRVSYFMDLVFSTAGLVTVVAVVCALPRCCRARCCHRSCTTHAATALTSSLPLQTRTQVHQQQQQQQLKQVCRKTAVYLLLFAYPIVAVKVVKAFACHDVDGARYLRADYTVDCGGAEWRGIAAYASVFLVGYVVALPAAVLSLLYRYSSRLLEGGGGTAVMVTGVVAGAGAGAAGASVPVSMAAVAVAVAVVRRVSSPL